MRNRDRDIVGRQRKPSSHALARAAAAIPRRRAVACGAAPPRPSAGGSFGGGSPPRPTTPRCDVPGCYGDSACVWDGARICERCLWEIDHGLGVRPRPCAQELERVGEVLVLPR